MCQDERGASPRRAGPAAAQLGNGARPPAAPAEIGFWGQTQGGLQHGRGTQVFPNGDVYQGEWHGGLIHGRGLYTYPCGAHYEGEFRCNLRHGRGTYVSAAGDVYEGEWSAGTRTGVGVFHYGGRDSGESYEGEFHSGRRHGRGSYRYTSGEVYSGQWENDQKHGHGVLRYPDGAELDCRWRNDRPHGEGVLRRGGAEQRLVFGEDGVAAAAPSEAASSPPNSPRGQQAEWEQQPQQQQQQQQPQRAAAGGRERARLLLDSCRAGLAMSIGESGGSVLVMSVRDGGPAHAAGLKRGDRVLEFCGERVSSKARFFALARELCPGDYAAVVVQRGRQRVESTVRATCKLTEADFLWLHRVAEGLWSGSAEELLRLGSIRLSGEFEAWP